MQLSKLRQHLEELEKLVASNGSFDEATADSIRSEVTAIRSALDELTEDHDEPLNDQLTRIAAEFEADYPQTSRVLERVADTLAKLGI